MMFASVPPTNDYRNKDKDNLAMSNTKILFIDDEQILRQTFKKALRDRDYRLYFAENGQEGLEIFHREAPDLIFLDLRMPVMDGFEFLKTINLGPADPFSVVVITGHGDNEEIQASYKLGVHSFLRKPLNMIEVNSLADRCIRFKKMEMDREKLITELQAAMTTINTLQKLLPICSACKKIRDPDEEWHDIESYIMAHTESQFSHSICPDCTKKLYPGFEEQLLMPRKKK